MRMSHLGQALGRPMATTHSLAGRQCLQEKGVTCAQGREMFCLCFPELCAVSRLWLLQLCPHVKM